MQKLSTYSLRRWKSVVAYAGGQFTSTATGLVLSYIVVAFFNTQWWGKVNAAQVYFSLAVTFASWGNKEYLLRQFSLYPAMQKTFFRQLLLARVPILFLSMLLLPFFSFDAVEYMHLLIWILAGYISQSTEVITLYEKKFHFPVAAEIISFLSAVTFLAVKGDTATYYTLLQALSLMQLVKMILLVVFFNRFFFVRSSVAATVKWDMSFIRKSLSFALVNFTGLLFSRGILIGADIYLDDYTLGKFRVLLALLIMVQAGGAYLFQPFAKGFYRMKEAEGNKLGRSLLLPGLIITVVATLLLQPFMQLFFKTYVDVLALIFAWVFMFSAYLILPYAYQLFKQQGNIKVLYINVISMLVLFLFLVLVMHFGQPDIAHVLLAASCTQLVMVAMFAFAASVKKEHV